MYDLEEYVSKEKPKKPNVSPVILANIPGEIRDHCRWVLWRWELRPDTQGCMKWNKVPCSGKLGEADEHWNRAKSNDAKTWTSLKEVVQHLPHFDGIGFMLGDGFAGIDLDKCRDPQTREIKEESQEIVREINSYAEVSPSQTGVKILIKAQKPAGRCRVGNFEMYSESRFFTITGQHLESTPKSIEARQAEVNRLHARMFPKQDRVAHKGLVHVCNGDDIDLTDAEILATARTAKNANKFNKLWIGDWQSLGYPSQSEADEALVGILAFWTGPDLHCIDRLFRRSGLYRDKWERQDYRERTISRVLDSQDDFFQSRDQQFRELENRALEIVQPVEMGQESKTKPADMPNKMGGSRASEFVGENKGKDAYYFQKLAQLFLEGNGQTLLKYRDKFFAYRDNRYVEEGELPDKLRRFLLRNKIPHNNNLIGNVVPIIGSLVFKSSGDYPSMPFFGRKEFFTNPESVIAYRNGLLDLEKYLQGDNSLMPHTPAWVSTVCLPYAFEPTAKCPQWKRFLNQVFENDPAKMDLLQEWFGYCLMHDTSLHKMMVLTGVPRSGKGTTMRMLRGAGGSRKHRRLQPSFAGGQIWPAKIGRQARCLRGGGEFGKQPGQISNSGNTELHCRRRQSRRRRKVQIGRHVPKTADPLCDRLQ